MRIEQELKITFDDVLIKPAYSDIINRETEIDVSVNFLGFRIAPIISSNMDFVTGPEMAWGMQNAGALGILNRFETITYQKIGLDFLKLGGYPGINPLYISVGIRDFEDSYKRINEFKPYGICIDVAHGEHSRVIELIKAIRTLYPTLRIIAGNIATSEGFYTLARAGADVIKVGIGPGSVCTTREVTGVGVPQLSAIIEAARERDKFFKDTLIIADGGINTSGDIVKALAAGADAVMLGKLLAGHDECPGDKIVLPDGRAYKQYRGQSMLGANGSRYAPEGISGYVNARGPVKDTIKTLVGGIRSGFSYVGARNISELRENTIFQLVSNATKVENATRVLQEV